MKELIGVKREYRVASYALVSAIVGVIVMRLIVYFLPIDSSTYGMSLVTDAIFSLPVQLVFFLGVPFTIYKFYGKRTVKETFAYSGFERFKPYHLLALPLGVCVWILTIGVSSAWMGILRATGYNSTSSSAAMPENFVFGFFIAEVAMTAILPAVCEEFCMRGGLLSTLKKSFGTVGCVVICGVAFGLFHQNIKQVFYTSLFGALAAFLTIKFKSIYPAVIVHFTNNFCSVFFDYADNYDWAIGGGFWRGIDSLSQNAPWALALLYVALAVVAFGLVFLMLYFKERKVLENKKEAIKDAAFDATNKRVVFFGELDNERIAELEMEKEVFGSDYKEEKYKPTVRDLAIGISLGVTALLTTVFTYVWGFFY